MEIDYSRIHYLKNRSTIIAKSSARYYANRTRALELRKLRYERNREQELRKARLYVLTPRGKLVAQAKWLRYRSALKGGDVTADELADLRRAQPTCKKCGSVEKLEIDHIIPLKREGRHTITNLQILCRTCNRTKAAKI